MKPNEIKYSFAYLNGEMVNINHFETKPEDEFFCIGCGRQLIARMGKIKRHHFSHKEDCECSSESYLHKLAKQTFYNEYCSALASNTPFIMEYQSLNICTHHWDVWEDSCSKVETNEYDLTAKYRKIEMEKSVGRFVADILLDGGNLPPILIEIAVTHTCEREKIESGLKIIEFKIESEEDIEKFKGRVIRKGSESKTTYHNIKRKTIKGDFCKGKCQNSKRSWFLIFPSQKCVIAEMTAEEFKRTRSKAVYYKMCDKSNGFRDMYSLDFKHYIYLAHEEGVQFRNCLLCKYHARGRYEAIFCKTHRMDCNSFAAITCDRFQHYPKVPKQVEPTQAQENRVRDSAEMEHILKVFGLE